MKPFERFYKHQQYFELIDKFKIKPWHWISLSVLVAGADFLSGTSIQFPILYVIPIGMAGWFSKRNYAILLATVLPCLRLIFHVIWDVPWLAVDSIVNILIRMAVFTCLAYLVSFVKELQVLRGFLHVCSYCGRIKNEDKGWVSMQEYITYHSEAMFSHGICPDCAPRFIE